MPGIALGYDWLMPLLSPSEKELFAHNIINRTLTKTRANFDQGLWWTEDIYNWNLVSHGMLTALRASGGGWFDELPLMGASLALHPSPSAGPIAAALAVGDYSEDVYPLASDIFSRSLEGISHALPSWAPDGVWPEGSK
jgi:hypothetical protein